MAYSLDQIDWCNVPLVSAVPDPEWEREVVRRFGFTSTLAKYLTPVRWLMEAEQLGEARVTPSIPVPLRAFISMVVAMDSSCRHCYGAFRSMLKILGYPEALIRQLEESFCHQPTDEQGASALEFARKISRSAPRPSGSDLRELTAAGYSQLEIAEIAYLASLNAGGNRLATLLAVPPSPLEEVDANWFTKLKRPFTRKEFRAALSYVVNVPYPAEFVVRALALSGPWKVRRQARPLLRFSTGHGIPRLLQDGSRRSYLLSLPVVGLSGVRGRGRGNSSTRGLDRARD